MTLRDALDRTLLLMKDDLTDAVSDDELLAALTRTTIVLVGDEATLASHAGQTAYVTAALLMARSGHAVHLIAPDVPLIGAQPPLLPGGLVRSLCQTGRDLLPDVTFCVAAPDREADLAVVLGSTPWAGRARRAIRLGATHWRALLCGMDVVAEWASDSWPFGPMGAAALAAGEAFKISMRRLQAYARDPIWFGDLYAPAATAVIDLAPPGTPRAVDLGNFDCVSGGAIINAALYALTRIPEVRGQGRIIEDDVNAISNLNRNMMLRRSRLGAKKATDLASLTPAGLTVDPVAKRYDVGTRDEIHPFAPRVLVGVDHIPTRWEVQRAWPAWLGIGATTHYSAMASYHARNLPCAGCLHPTDDATDAPIPTVAFVSFWAGLWLASLLVRHMASSDIVPIARQVYFSPLRPETLWSSPVAARRECPVACSVSGSSSGRAL